MNRIQSQLTNTRYVLAGKLETFHIIRNHLNFYTNVIVSCAYSSPHILTHELLSAALCKVVEAHPPLCAGLYVPPSKTTPPSYTLLPHIPIYNLITFSSGNVAPNHYRDYTTLIEAEHNLPFPATLKVGPRYNTSDILAPQWRVHVLERSYNNPTAYNSNFNYSGRKDYEILFIYHHAIGDGLSGAAFHYSLLSALNSINPTSRNGPHGYSPPATLQLLPAMEDEVDLKLGVKTVGKLGGIVAKSIIPNFLHRKAAWLGNEGNPATLGKTRVAMAVLRDYSLEHVLRHLKKIKVSMTAWLTYNVAGCFWQLLKSDDPKTFEKAKVVKAGIPISFRGMAADEGVFGSGVMTDCISGLDWEIDRFDFKDTGVGSAAGNGALRKLTAALKEAREKTRDSEVGLLAMVADMEGFWKGQIGKPRGSTFEVSNLGVLDDAKLGLEGKCYTKAEREAATEPEWRINEAVFSQGATNVGALFAVQAATVRGKMVVTVRWMEGTLPDEGMEFMTKHLEHKLQICK